MVFQWVPVLDGYLTLEIIRNDAEENWILVAKSEDKVHSMILMLDRHLSRCLLSFIQMALTDFVLQPIISETMDVETKMTSLSEIFLQLIFGTRVYGVAFQDFMSALDFNATIDDCLQRIKIQQGM